MDPSAQDSPERRYMGNMGWQDGDKSNSIYNQISAMHNGQLVHAMLWWLQDKSVATERSLLCWIMQMWCNFWIFIQ